MPIHHTYISPRMGSTNRDTYGHGVRRNTGSTYHDHAVNGLKYWYEYTKPMPCKYDGIQVACITIMRSMALSIGARILNLCHVSRKEYSLRVSQSCSQWPQVLVRGHQNHAM